MKNTMQSLSGLWKIVQDPDNTGREKGWPNAIPEGDVREIVVPGNLPGEPLLNMELYGDVYPSELFLDMNKADKVLCASITLNGFIENNCARSLTLSEYAKGEGKYILNAFLIEQNLGRHPVADQLMLNMLEHYGK